MICRSLLACLLATTCMAAPLHAADKPNVLFIAIDDLNDWIGCLGGHPQVKTPHIDSIAKRGTLFTNAHCQSPLCNPSRSSLMTGLRPSTTGIYGLAPGIRDVEMTKDWVTLPQTFLKAGYHTYSCGKIYHDGAFKPKDRAAEFGEWGPAPGMPRPPERFAKLPGKQHPLMDWGPWPATDEEGGDYKIATAAVAAIKSAPKDKPFFIACGFRQPHVPCFAPQKWFDLYPNETLKLPPILKGDRDDTPRFSWYIHWKLPEPRLSTLEECDELKPLVRAYLATTSYMDDQVGRVLKALEESGRAKDTIIVLWSDHGYHLGEKAISGKNTLWDRSTRVPLIFAGKGIAANAKCSRPAELLDIFPTLIDLCGFEKRSDLEGHSLLPQLKDANAPREHPAITTHNHDNHGIRTEDWRYIRYADGTEELYDMRKDPNEWKNLAADTQYAKVKSDLAKWLPKVNRKPVEGSRHRVLTFDAKTGETIWEGQAIGKDDAVPTP